MKWTYSIRNKLAASGALFALCLLVLFSNYLDRRHTNNVKQSISTLYEDRLVVEDYILKMTIDTYEIKQALQSNQLPSPSDQITARLSHIDGLSAAYRKTKFTQREDSTFSSLVKTISELESSPSDSIHDKLTLSDQALVKLNRLSAIQLEESRLIMNHVEGLYRSGKAASQFAFVITVVILLVLQALVFTSKTLSVKQPPTNLN